MQPLPTAQQIADALIAYLNTNDYRYVWAGVTPDGALYTCGSSLTSDTPVQGLITSLDQETFDTGPQAGETTAQAAERVLAATFTWLTSPAALTSIQTDITNYTNAHP